MEDAVKTIESVKRVNKYATRKNWSDDRKRKDNEWRKKNQVQMNIRINKKKYEKYFEYCNSVGIEPLELLRNYIDTCIESMEKDDD